MKKILHVNTTLNIGGIENFLLNVYKNINKSKYEFIFLCYKNEKFDYEEELKKLGAKIIKISDPKKVSTIKHMKEIIKVIKTEKVDIVHCHTYFDSGVVLLAARIAKVKCRIAHSHTTEGQNKVTLFRKVKWQIARGLIKLNSTVNLACSKEAGIALFPHSHFKVITNGFDTSKFKYSSSTRKKIRDKYDIKNSDILIGHVGRLEEAKNHLFMLDLMQEMIKEDRNYKLMLVGGGSYDQKIKERIRQNHLEKQVILVGSVMNSSDYYNAFDCFLFPSIYEGLGISLIEAEVNGLPCIASTNVPKESKLCSNVYFKDLKDGIENWKEFIINCPKKREKDNEVIISKSMYDIRRTVTELEKIYNK